MEWQNLLEGGIVESPRESIKKMERVIGEMKVEKACGAIVGG